VNITEGLFRQARRVPDAPAILTPQFSLTYAELANAVAFSAARFQKDGLVPGDIVAVSLSSQLQHLVASLALARLGAGQLSMHPNDPPALRRDLERRLRIATTISAGPLENHADLGSLPATPFAAPEDRNLPFLVKRTSGTTADAPRLAVLTHGMAHAWLHDFDDTLPEGPGHRVLSLIPVTFTGPVHTVLRCLSLGGCLALPEGIGGYGELAQFILRHRIDYLAGGPVHAAGLLGVANQVGERLFPEVNAFRVSTTLIPEPMREAIRARLTPNLFIFYGVTEVGSLTLATPDLVARVPGVVGYPVHGVAIQAVDAGGIVLLPGQRGTLRARSAGMITEYLDDPAETARVFRDGWFHSSDLVEFTPEGALIHHGRADDLMIFDGINIHPAEIESALLKHPAVAAAAAFSIKGAARGDVPHAAVVLKEKVEARDLHAHCRHWLGARSPAGIMIVRALPRNAAGKVLRRELVTRWKSSASS
jgi:acyl-coenzyme A synthetase/AMP-(fatty) acid ligase